MKQTFPLNESTAADVGAAFPLHIDLNNNPERPWVYPSTQAEMGPNEEFPEKGAAD